MDVPTYYVNKCITISMNKMCSLDCLNGKLILPRFVYLTVVYIVKSFFSSVHNLSVRMPAFINSKCLSFVFFFLNKRKL